MADELAPRNGPTSARTSGRTSATHALRQVVFTGIDRVEVLTTELTADPGPGEVLLAPQYVGICGSDLAALTGRHPWFTPPLVTGHEVTARVSAAGPQVADYAIGDAVLLNPLRGCGACRRCLQGRPNQCPDGAVRGFRLPGAAVTSLVVSTAELHHVPDGLELALATLAEPLAAAWRAATRWDELDRVAVIGAGSIGQLVLASLRHRGASHITVVEPSAAKRSLALTQGADVAAVPGELGDEPRFTAVFDCVSTQDTVDWAIASTMGGGAVVTVGVPESDRRVALPRTQRQEIALLGSGLYTRDDVDTALTLIADGTVEAGRLVSGSYPLDEAAAAYTHAREPDAVKILLRMTSEDDR